MVGLYHSKSKKGRPLWLLQFPGMIMGPYSSGKRALTLLMLAAGAMGLKKLLIIR